MILQDPLGRPAAADSSDRATLDDLFRLTAMRRPSAIALIDPPNRESFTDGPPRSLTYAQADRTITAIAGRLRRIGLNTDAIVGLQFANTVESVLTLLAVLRAGLIAMPLPLLWRRADAVAALSRVGVQALIVSGRVGSVDHFDLAMQVAAETFPVRFVCGFGDRPPDGVIGLDDLHAAEWLDPLP
jgi:acyl-CoA synthetase (AMP-forming)/AMP-acid ligase II